MTDAEIVQALVAGEQHGLAAAYRRYADRLYDYCAGLLGDRDTAADAVHDTFLIARERAAQLRDPAALRPWLYAIARSRALRMIRERGRERALEGVAEVPDETVEAPEAGPRREELRALVRSALGGLNPREREVIDLSLRHELSGAELAAALGVPAKQAHAVAATARAQLERALGAVVLARTRGRDCAELRALLAAWDGELSPLWRKRIHRHVTGCRTCAEQRRRLVSPAALLGTAPVLVAPPALYERLMASAVDPALVARHAALARDAGPYRPDGFPHGAAAASAVPRTTRVVSVAAVLLALVLLSGAPEPVALLSPALPDVAPGAPAPAHPGGAGPADVVPGSGPSGGGDGSAPETIGDADALWVEGLDATGPGCVSRWILDVTVGAGGDVAAATLTLHGDPPVRVAMEPDGSGVWRAVVDGLPVDRPVSWSVTVTRDDGTRDASGTRELVRAGCPPAPETDPDEPSAEEPSPEEPPVEEPPLEEPPVLVPPAPQEPSEPDPVG